MGEKYLTFMHGIANEIVQNGGEAYVMRAELVNGNKPHAITKFFCRERGEKYHKLEQYKERLEVFSQ